MKQDRFLIAILVAIVILVITALILFVLRQDGDDYGPDDTPAGVVRNYVIAIHKEDFQRAYNAIQNSSGKPNYQAFRQPFLTQRLDNESVSVRIAGSKVFDDEAIVKLILTHGGTGLFQSSWHEEGNALLVLENGAWKISQMPYPYWGWNWYTKP